MPSAPRNGNEYCTNSSNHLVGGQLEPGGTQGSDDEGKAFCVAV
jgi:hypothetical protein